MKTTDLQQVIFVNCDEEINGQRTIHYKGIYSTPEKALAAILNDIDQEVYNISGSKYEDITAENIMKVIESGEAYIITAQDNGKCHTIIPCLGYKNASKYYYINLEEIK